MNTGNQGFPAGNPIANALVIIVGGIAIAASIVLGFFAFVILASVLIVLSAVIGIRVWWFRRRFQKSQRNRAESPDATRVIEGEYRVVVEERESSER